MPDETPREPRDETRSETVAARPSDDDTIAIRGDEDFDHDAVLRYLQEHVPGVGAGPLDVRQFPSGRSNLTYLLRAGEWEGVLRRQPLGPVPPRAHDMVREASLLAKLSAVYPLAPKPYAIEEDPSLLGVPFYVMERRRGVVVDDRFPPGVTPTPELCARLSELVVDTLAQLHAIDWRAAGLESFGRPDGFLERQVRGWIERYQRARTMEIAAAEPVMRWLAGHVPPSPPATIIHNDFKLNNMLLDLGAEPRISGILDWEMSTIGDPLFDLAVSLSYWIQADDAEEMRSGLSTVTTLPGFYTRRQFVARYAARTGRDISTQIMGFHMTFAYFKLAVIIQQIFARWSRGQTQDKRFAIFGERVRLLIEHAQRLAESGADAAI